MNATGNFCVNGILQMRRHFPVDPELVRQVEPNRKAFVSDCPRCGRPNVPTVKDGEIWVLSEHTVSNLDNAYTKKRSRPWDR